MGDLGSQEGWFHSTVKDKRDVSLFSTQTSNAAGTPRTEVIATRWLCFNFVEINLQSSEREDYQGVHHENNPPGDLLCIKVIKSSSLFRTEQACGDIRKNGRPANLESPAELLEVPLSPCSTW